MKAKKETFNQILIDEIRDLTSINHHNENVLLLASAMENKIATNLMIKLTEIHEIRGDMSGLVEVRNQILNELLATAKKRYTNYDEIYKSF